jgi:hypothetical protein
VPDEHVRAKDRALLVEWLGAATADAVEITIMTAEDFAVTDLMAQL